MSGKQEIIELEKGTDFGKILKENEKVLIDFGANWCQPCKILHKQLENFMEKGMFKGVKVVAIDIEKHEALSQRWEVQSVPTLIFFKNGKPIKQQVGASGMAQMKDTLQKWVEL